MDKYYRLMDALILVEKEMEYMKWVEAIPYINFPDKYEIKIIPPFRGAIVRFIVQIREQPELGTRSVYLDCYDRLGHFGEPYWELYPCAGEDVYRCRMDDVQALLEAIEESYCKEAMNGQV